MGEKSRFTRCRATRLLTAVALSWFGWVGIPPAEASTAVLVGAGDIASCWSSGDAATAALVRSIGGTVFTLGDNAYQNGSWRDFNACYGRTWGRVKSRTRPAIGNHEYGSRRGARYWDYFGKAAGPRGKGWYSYNAGSWHVIVLNANCDKVRCGKGSEQERWLRSDLAAHNKRCTLAYWHQSRFSSDKAHGNDSAVAHSGRRSTTTAPRSSFRVTATSTSASRPRPRGAGPTTATGSASSSWAAEAAAMAGSPGPSPTARSAIRTPSVC